MTTQTLRDKAAAMLAEEILSEPDAFYAAFDEGDTGVTEWLTARWETVCAQNGETLEAHPFFPETEFWLLDETDEDFACMMVSTLPALTETPDTCLLGVVFGAKMDPRVFTGVRTGGGITLREHSRPETTVQTAECGRFPVVKRLRQAMAEQIYAICDSYESGV